MPGRGGYFRSGSGPKDRVEELGLRGDMVKGVGITTVIRSIGSPEHEDLEIGRSSRLKSCASKKVLGKSESHAWKESSDEYLPLQKPGVDWGGVRKITEVRTSEEKQLKGERNS
jgi:hypothetical protein